MSYVNNADGQHFLTSQKRHSVVVPDCVSAAPDELNNLFVSKALHRGVIHARNSVSCDDTNTHKRISTRQEGVQEALQSPAAAAWAIPSCRDSNKSRDSCVRQM